MLAQRRPAGVPDDSTPDEFERWSNGLVAFLTSESVPANFRGWAQQQVDLLDAYLASDADLDADPGDEDVAPAAAAPAPSAKKKAPRTKQHAAADTRGEGMLVIQVPAQAGKLFLGLAVGILLVLGVIAARQFSDNGGSSLPPSANAAATPAFDQARADQLNQTLQTDPSNKDALYELGELYFEGARYEDSITALTKLVALDPTNKQALNDIGTANFNLGRTDEARVWWQKTLAVDANDVQAHYNLGFLYASVDPRDLAAAVGEWETVVRLDPTSQLGQTAAQHVQGLKNQLTATPGTGNAAASPTVAAATPTVVAP